eukprot:scaffold147401_cov45-Attheya_sp.AAC.1
MAMGGPSACNDVASADSCDSAALLSSSKDDSYKLYPRAHVYVGLRYVQASLDEEQIPRSYYASAVNDIFHWFIVSIPP